jgi:hypothetical protein
VLSPDGQSVGFYESAGPTTYGQLRKISLAGGASVALTPMNSPLGMS